MPAVASLRMRCYASPETALPAAHRLLPGMGLRFAQNGK